MLYVINILYYLIADLDLLLVISCYSKLCYGVKIVLSQDEYLLPTTSKPLIYLCFLRSYNYTPTMQERPPFGAVFCDIKQCALALGFFLERCRRQRILHLAFSHIFLTGEGVDEAGTFFPKCFYCRWSQRPHFLKYFAN